MHEVTVALTGSVWKILVSDGAAVAADEEIMILESMKMEVPVTAPVAGIVTSLEVAEGDPVDAGTVVARIRP